jgi:hypothetical protein
MITRFGKEMRFDKPMTFKNRFQGKWNNNSGFKANNQTDRKFKPHNKSNKTYAEQMEGIDISELDKRKAAGECQRCAWPGDRKGAPKAMDCFRWARKEVGMALFPKVKKYYKLKVGAYDQEEDSESEIDLYTTDQGESDDSEVEDSEHEENSATEVTEDFEEDEHPESEEELEQTERNWWDSDGED